MKRIILLILALGLFSIVHADNWVRISASGSNQLGVQLLSSNIDQTTLQLNLNGFWYNEVSTPKGMAWEISLENAAVSLIKGSPSLPHFSSSLIIPAQAKMEVDIVNSSYVEYYDVLIAPSKGNFDRTIDPAEVDYIYGPQYQRNEFYPRNLSSLREPYIIRDFRGETVLFNPFVYNPITKTLRVYYQIEVNIHQDGASKINILSSKDLPSVIDTRFNTIYKRQFLNYQSATSRYTPVEEDGNLLIICYGDFMDEMDPYIDWKIKTGTEVEIVDVATIGGASQIKTYIADYYNDNGLTFVLLVGDAQQLPSSSIGGNDSDVNYSYIEGNDHYPDIFVGRFSAQTSEHVSTQVQRTIDYERYPVSMSGWYDNAIGIASDQGPGDDNELDYEHIRNISNNKLLPFTYTYAYELFDGSQGGEDASGNPTPTQVAAAINSGATVINYTGHGSDVSWGTSGFSSNNVNSMLTNTAKLPFIFSVACVNGNFVGTTCFAEAWLRAEDNGEPTGAVAALMSTINQSWNPPMQGQDDMNDILSEADANNIKRTFGGISMNGCMAMNDAYGSDGEEMTDTWTIFGDPSLMIRTAIPQDMTISHDPTIPMGSTTFTVNCDVDDALAVLSMNGEIIGSAYASGGVATIVFPALADLGVMDLVVTAFNYNVYESTVEIIAETGPYVVYATNSVNDADGNNNGLVDYTESILLSLGLTDAGSSDAIDVNATITTNSEFITLNDDTEVYGDIAVDDTVAVADGFAFDVSDNIPDGSVIGINVTATDADGKAVWESSFVLNAHSPALSFNNFVINDSNGNNNGRLDPGEEAQLNIFLANNGSSEAFNISGTLSTDNEYVSIENPVASFGDLMGQDTTMVVYNISVSDIAPDGNLVQFEMNFTADFNISALGDFSAYIGLKPVLVMDFGTNVNSATEMTTCFTTLNVGADLESNMPSSLDMYKSIFVVLGAYPDNHVLSADEANMLNTYLENGGRVYMEGGDTWAFDYQTAFHNKFMINGIDDGQGDVSRILGYEGSMLQGYGFEFQGVNNYIDRLAPLNGAQVILQNESPSYATAISFENETYKTIGSSADFGGLVNEEGSNKDGLMSEYLYFFGIDYVWTGLNENKNTNVAIKAYPNPFSNSVDLSINIDKTNNVEVSICNLNGKKISTLYNGEMNKGNHQIKWDATKVPAGIYLYSIKTTDNSFTGKLMLTK